MAILGEIQVRNIFVGGQYPAHATMTALRAGANLDLAVLEPDGTAVTSGSFFQVSQKNFKGTISNGDVIDPSRVTYGNAIKASAAVGMSTTISDITVTVGEQYTVELIVSGFGSLSVEDELLLLGYYKAVTGDDAETIVDNLIKNLSNNVSRQQPDVNTTFGYKLKSGTVVQYRDNLCLDFLKVTTDGTNEVFTLTVTVAASSAGNTTLTLDDVDWTIPVTVGASVTETATEIATYIDNYIPGYTASNAAGVITVTSIKGLDETDATFDEGTTGITAAVVVTVQGVDGTDFAIRVSDKFDWIASYYVTGRKDRLTFDYKVNAYFPTTPTFTRTAGSAGSGTGYQVRNMEYYYKGNVQDTFRELGFPHNFETHYDSILTGSYNLIEIGYNDEGRDDPLKSKKHLTIAIEDLAQANLIIAQINLALTNNPIVIPTLV